MGCYYQYCLCQEACPSVTEKKIQRGIENREVDKLRKQYIQEKGCNVIEMYKCDWSKKYKTDKIAKQHLRESFPYNMPLRKEKLLENIKSGSLFGYVQCDIEVPENLREVFVNFPHIFKNINVGRDDSGPFLKEDAKKEAF